MAITLADFSKIWASTSPLTPYSFSESNYKEGWNFVGQIPPSRQMWDFLQKNNDEKMQYLANNYLPLSGGTMTGAIKGVGTFIACSRNDSYNQINGGIGTHDGSHIILFGKDDATRKGWFYIEADDGTNSKRLQGNPDGTLTWNNYNILTASNYNSYALPLSGGTMTGNITSSVADAKYLKANDSGANNFFGGTNWNKGGFVSIYGKDSTNALAGGFRIGSHDGSNGKFLDGKPDGTLTWDGQPIQTSSDKRLKQDFSAVPYDVLDAWGKVNWQQFKYKADAQRKGDSCRFHTGLVAQDVKEVGEENNVDLLKYGILCHDVREAVEEEKDENGNVIKEASEAVDLWTVRYEEALAMEVIYLRNEIKKLHEEIKALRTE